MEASLPVAHSLTDGSAAACATPAAPLAAASHAAPAAPLGAPAAAATEEKAFADSFTSESGPPPLIEDGFAAPAADSSASVPPPLIDDDDMAPTSPAAGAAAAAAGGGPPLRRAGLKRVLCPFPPCPFNAASQHRMGAHVQTVHAAAQKQ